MRRNAGGDREVIEGRLVLSVTSYKVKRRLGSLSGRSKGQQDRGLKRGQPMGFGAMDVLSHSLLDERREERKLCVEA